MPSDLYRQASLYCVVVLVLLPRPVDLAALIVKPENHVINIGDETTLSCRINTTYNSAVISAAWKLYRPDGTSCNVYTGSGIVQSCVDGARFSISSPNAGQFDLVIADGKSEDAGTYRCTHLADSGSESEPADCAHGVVGEPAPRMTQSPPAECTLKDDIVQLMCEVINYNGNILMAVKIAWNASDGSPVHSNGTFPTNGTSTTSFSSTVDVPAANLKTVAYKCALVFEAPTSPTIPPTSVRSAYAPNVPDYNSSATSTPYTPQHCPSVVSIKLDNGEEFPGGDISAETTLYCSVSDASSNIVPKYVWTDSTGSVISEGVTTTIGTQPGEYSVTCTAESRLCSRTCADKPNKTVSGTASNETTAQTPHNDLETTIQSTVVNYGDSGIHSNVTWTLLLGIVTAFCTLRLLRT